MRHWRRACAAVSDGNGKTKSCPGLPGQLRLLKNPFGDFQQRGCSLLRALLVRLRRTTRTKSSLIGIFCQVQKVNCPEGARETTLGCAPTENDKTFFAAAAANSAKLFRHSELPRIAGAADAGKGYRVGAKPVGLSAASLVVGDALCLGGLGIFGGKDQHHQGDDIRQHIVHRSGNVQISQEVKGHVHIG